MALSHETITRTPRVVVPSSAENFTVAANEDVIVAYAPSDSDTVAPEEPWFERRPGDVVTRTLLGPGHVWARIVRVDRRSDATTDLDEIVLPIVTW